MIYVNNFEKKENHVFNHHIQIKIKLSLNFLIFDDLC